LDLFERIKKDYDEFSSALTVVAPFISSLLRRVRIILSEDVPTAGVTRNDIMAINPKFWANLQSDAKAWLLAHETMHIAFRDAKRAGHRNHFMWNLVTDRIMSPKGKAY